MLLYAPGHTPTLSGADEKLYTGFFLRRGGPPQKNDSLPGQRTSVIAGPVRIPNRSLFVSLENAVTHYQPPNSTHIDNVKQAVSLRITNAKSALLERIPIVTEDFANQSKPYLPSMQVLRDDVYVSFEKRIFRWKFKTPAAGENVDLDEFFIVPRQSQFVFKKGKSTLKHDIRGGKKPLDYVLLSPSEGLSFNKVTGDIDVDSDVLAQASISLLTRMTSSEKDYKSAVAKLQPSATNSSEMLASRLNVKFTGFPIAVPIHFKIIDGQGQVLEMQYFVILDIPYPEIKRLLNLK
jgi:hypothetical protein